MKKLFGEINLTWKKVIIAAIILGVYTGIVAMLPITTDTSFRDIAISFEWWILFGVIIITNSRSAKDSALKCFVFFLISQPLVYLVQVPFNIEGFGIFKYYPDWFKWTLLTIPMGFIGYYLKKDKWWGLFILVPVMLFLGIHYEGFLSETLTFFPHRILSTIFCLATIIIYPLYIFKNKIVKRIGVGIGVLIIIVMTVLAINGGKNYYRTTILISDNNNGVAFDDSYKVYLTDPSYGSLFIVYEANIESYMVNAEFKKIGNTEFVLESPDGTKTKFLLKVERRSYKVTKKED